MPRGAEGCASGTYRFGAEAETRADSQTRPQASGRTRLPPSGCQLEGDVLVVGLLDSPVERQGARGGRGQTDARCTRPKDLPQLPVWQTTILVLADPREQQVRGYPAEVAAS